MAMVVTTAVTLWAAATFNGDDITIAMWLQLSLCLLLLQWLLLRVWSNIIAKFDRTEIMIKVTAS